MSRIEAIERIATHAKALAEAVTQDDSGSLVAGQWMGGGGGLLSRETIAAADRVRLALDALKTARDVDVPL